MNVIVRLSYDEALVLSDMLSRWERDGVHDTLPFADQAEQRLVWDLTASFDPIIDEALSDEYDTAVADARSRLRDQE